MMTTTTMAYRSIVQGDTDAEDALVLSFSGTGHLTAVNRSMHAHGCIDVYGCDTDSGESLFAIFGSYFRLHA